MIKQILSVVFILVLVSNTHIFSQSTKLTTRESIGWYNYFGTYRLNDQFGIHTEYQFRRENIITNWQQSLLRVGVNFNLSPRVLFRVGYAWIETFTYGEIPINGLGKDFTEHRIFQMAQLGHKEGIVDLSHRFILEQRFVGSYSTSTLEQEDGILYFNRLRYMFRVQVPFNRQGMRDKTPYFAFFDEIFVGFGENVNNNVFDQNRFGFLIGYRFNKDIRIDGGYINQILQFSRQINGQNAFQNNQGVIINAIFNMDLNKRIS